MHRLGCSIRLSVRAIPRLDVFAMPRRSIEERLPPAPKNLLRRLGEFVAEAWEEAGETVRQCKAA